MKFVLFALACVGFVAAQHDHSGHSHEHGAQGVSKVGDTHYVNWNPASAPFSNIDATVGESIAFEYDSGSNIIAFRSKKHYDACNIGKSQQMASSQQGGGAGGTNLFQTKLNQPGVLYLASTIGCAQGQKLVLSIGSGDCSGHSHSPGCAHTAHSATEEPELVCGDHSHDPRCGNAHSPHTAASSTPARTAPAPARTATAASSSCPSCPSCGSAAGAPSAPRAGGTSHKGKDKIVLVWAAPSENAEGATYTIQYGDNVLETTDTTHTINGLNRKTRYSFKVTASNDFGNSKTITIKTKTK